MKCFQGTARGVATLAACALVGVIGGSAIEGAAAVNRRVPTTAPSPPSPFGFTPVAGESGGDGAVRAADRRDRVVLTSAILSNGSSGDLPNIELSPLFEVPGEPDPPQGDGTYRLVARDAIDAVVLDQPIAVGAYSDGTRVARGVVRLPAAAVALQLVGSGAVIAERRASPNPPLVTALKPRAGERWREDRRYRVSHSVSDPDGDKVLVTTAIRSAPDDSWFVFHGRDTVRSELISANEFAPTKHAKIRFQASDGFHTSFTESPEFTILPRTRVYDILVWGQGNKGKIDSTRLRLNAEAHDPNSGKEIKRIKWYWRGKVIGKGRSLATGRFRGRRGRITLTVRAFGEGGITGGRRVRLRLIPNCRRPRCDRVRSRG